MDAYHKGLQGKGAAWAAKKYRGHRGVPMTILEDSPRTMMMQWRLERPDYLLNLFVFNLRAILTILSVVSLRKHCVERLQ